MATRDPDPTRTAGTTPVFDTTVRDTTQVSDRTQPAETTRAAGTRPIDLTVTTPTRPDILDSGDPITLDDVEAGQRIDDFDLLTALGIGAFGRVFLARQQSMQRLVAVKVSRNSGNEAQTLAQLDHDYIVRVFDQRILPDHGLRLLYMQYMPGGTLLRVLHKVRATPPEQRTGRLLLDSVDEALQDKGEIRPSESTVREHLAGLSWPETVAWLGRRLADALHYAESRGVLHRDIKPANVLLTAEGVPKLADFNISFAESVDDSSPLAYLGGSLAYMSPEQLEACHPHLPRSAADLDTRSDIYALGVMLWELLTASRPTGDSNGHDANGPTMDALDSMLTTRRSPPGAEALAQLPNDCPQTLRRVLTRCLAPEAADRWASGAELAQQFDLCLDARARELVDPPPKSWRARLRRPVIPMMIAAIGIPNALGALYNFQHNQNLIVDHLSPESQLQFQTIALIINAIVFPLGALVIIYLARRLITVPRGLRRERPYDTAELARARHDALLIADRVTAVVMTLWVLSGITFPVVMQYVTGALDGRAITHFVASIVVCGAIAVAYPFFFVSFYMVRSIYPAFLPHGATDATDARELEGLHRRSIRYLAVAAAVPLAAVAGSTFLTIDEIPQVQLAVRVLSVGSIGAFVLVYWLFRLMEQDLEALQRSVAVRTDRRLP